MYLEAGFGGVNCTWGCRRGRINVPCEATRRVNGTWGGNASNVRRRRGTDPPAASSSGSWPIYPGSREPESPALGDAPVDSPRPRGNMEPKGGLMYPRFRTPKILTP